MIAADINALPTDFLPSHDAEALSRRRAELRAAVKDFAAARGRAPKLQERLVRAMLGCWIDGVDERSLAPILGLSVAELRVTLLAALAAETRDEIAYQDAFAER